MTFYSFPGTALPHGKKRGGVAKADRIAAAAAVTLYFAVATYSLPASEYLHSLGGGALIFVAVFLAGWFLERGWLPGWSVLAVGFISFAVLVMPSLPVMGGRALRAIPIGFLGVQAAILLWAVLQWPYTLPARSRVSLVSALGYGLAMAAGISVVATLPILLTLFSKAPSSKAILLVYPAYAAGFVAAAIVYWSLQTFAYLAVGRYLMGVLGGTCVYGAIAPVVFIFNNEPIKFPLLFAIAGICGGFIGPALALDSPDRTKFVTAERRNIAWSVKRGVLLSVAFSITLGVAMLIRGPEIYGDATFLRTIGVTMTFGLIGGLCVGALDSFTTRYWGALIVGSLGGVLAFAAIFIVIFGFDPIVIRFSLVGGILVGPRVAAMMWRNRRPGLSA